MPRTMLLIFVAGLAFAFAAGVQAGMKPTAPQKMTSPDQKKKMDVCEQNAAQQNIKMDERAKFVMDCMTAKTK